MHIRTRSVALFAVLAAAAIAPAAHAVEPVQAAALTVDSIGVPIANHVITLTSAADFPALRLTRQDSAPITMEKIMSWSKSAKGTATEVKETVAKWPAEVEATDRSYTASEDVITLHREQVKRAALPLDRLDDCQIPWNF